MRTEPKPVRAWGVLSESGKLYRSSCVEHFDAAENCLDGERPISVYVVPATRYRALLAIEAAHAKCEVKWTAAFTRDMDEADGLTRGFSEAQKAEIRASFKCGKRRR